MQLYPLILIFCWFWATINRIHGIFESKSPFWLQALHIFFGNLQGLLNAFVYGFTDKVKSILKNKIFGKTKEEDNIINVNLSSINSKSLDSISKNF